VCAKNSFWSQKLSIDKSLVQNLFVGQNNNALRTTAQGCMNNCTTLYKQLHNAVWTAQRCTNRTTLYEPHNAVRTAQRCMKRTTLYEQPHNAVRTTAQHCTNNHTTLYEQPHNTVWTAQRCMNNCTMLYEQLHNAVRTTAQRCTNNRINNVRTTSQCCMNNCAMLYKQLHNTAHRSAVSLPTTSYTQTSFTLGWQLVTFPKSTVITCIDKLLLQHGLMEQRINI